MIWTDFTFSGLKNDVIEKAKDLFLLYSGEKTIEKTKNGELIQNLNNRSRIFVNEICVAEEENL